MAELTGITQIFSGNTTEVDTVLNHPLGTRARDEAGNEYVYLTGASSTAAGSWVTFDEDKLTTLTAANAVGPVAVAMAAVDSTSEYGWYQIYGHVATALAITDGDCAANVQLYLTSTAGTVDDVDVAGDHIIGAISRVAETTTAGYIEAQINYPFVSNVDFA